MTFWDWLNTPAGQDIQRSLALLVTSLAAYFAYLSKRQSEQNAKLLDGHIRQHGTNRRKRTRLVEIKERPSE